jgi:BirA family biotin operon repressor/biotin-[acetyl-CoA-carboxylase] ligase
LVNLFFIMVNRSRKNSKDIDENAVSTKAKLLGVLREQQGRPVNGTQLARFIGKSRVSVWKGIQTLLEAGYPVETLESGYALDPQRGDDFLYPWEFGGQEQLFRHFENTGSTMDRAREFALQGLPTGTVITAEKQSSGRGRNGRTWASRQGGLFFTILERPSLSVADYTLPSMIFQIAVARVLTVVSGKRAVLRWPNDIYIDQRKISGVITEIAGEGDLVQWLTGGIGVNVNNPAPSGKTISCAEIAGRPVSRRELLQKILDEIGRVKSECNPGAVYAQGNRLLAEKWNSLADCIGAKAAVIDSGFGEYRKETALSDNKHRVLAKGIFSGVDPAGRCIIASETGKGTLYFNPGPASVIFLTP